MWNIPALLALQLLARQFSWWQFDASGGVLLGMPVDLYLAWAWLWGAVPVLALGRQPLLVSIGMALGADLIVMPLAAPVVPLGPQWLIGEAIALVMALVPAQLLARWFERRSATGLLVVPAETHRSGSLTRVTYEADGVPSVSGVIAIARALEHVHLGWALVGCAFRLPIVRQLTQLLVDASGAESRTIVANPAICNTSSKR